MKYIFVITLSFITLICSGQDIRLFYLSPMDNKGFENDAFISLSDETLHLGVSANMGYVHFDDEELEAPLILKTDRRTSFLKSIGISENHDIHVYNMLLDSIFIFPIATTDLIEKPNAYEGTEIGFRILNLPLQAMGYYGWNTFVHIGDANPFVTGNIHPIKWTEVDSTLFPDTIKSSNHSEWVNSLAKEKVYRFHTETHTYYIQNLISNKYGIAGRHLVVLLKNTNTVVFNQAYMDSESTGLSALISESENNQWTGKIFKDKPPIVYGFLWISFGCPWIDFIGQKEQSISILCDNRH